MTCKRRNGGKNRNNRGHVKPIHCSNCHRLVPKDKAVKRFMARNMIETAAHRDLKDASVYETYALPKMYMKMTYCISCAIHSHIVRVRSRQNRRIRTPPSKFKTTEKKVSA